MTNISGRPGAVRSGSTRVRPLEFAGRFDPAAGGRRANARCPEDGPADVDPPPVGDDRTLPHVLDLGPGQHLDVQAGERLPRHLREPVGKGRQEPRARLEQKDTRARRIGPSEFRRKGPPRKLGKRARKLDAGRAAADDGKGQQAQALLGIFGRLGALEGLEHPAPDGDRVLDRLKGGSIGLPLVMAEIGMAGPGCEHQKIVAEFSRRRRDGSTVRIHCEDPCHEHRRVRLPSHDVPDWPGDVGRRERRSRRLIEQGLEAMMVLGVDDEHLDGRAGELRGGSKAPEAAADDENPWRPHGGSLPDRLLAGGLPRPARRLAVRLEGAAAESGKLTLSFVSPLSMARRISSVVGGRS